MKDIVLGHKIERDELLRQGFVLREGIEGARKSLDTDLIKVIVGPRRAGKSVFALQSLQDIDFAYLNFDDERLAGISDYDEILKAIIQVYGNTRYFLFDEIQNLERWELLVNRLQRRGYNLVLTGSNSRLLSAELASHLTGRYIQFQVFPFSFTEFLKAKDFPLDEMIELKEKQGMLLSHFDDYMLSGGFPEVVVKGVGQQGYLKTLFDGILFKDIVKRYNVRQPQRLYDIGLYLLTNHSNEFSLTRLKNMLGFRSIHTVESYFGFLKEAFLVFDMERFSFKLREKMKSPRKVYGYDTGMIHAVKFRTSPDRRRLLENLVAIEFLRQGRDFYFYRTKDNKEVDFVIRDGLEVSRLIQVSYKMDSDPQTEKREISALLKAAKELGCDDLAMLTWDQEAERMVNGKKVMIVPLWRWIISQRATS
jgi:predicted AAA+ superfamily ATPase